MPGALVTGTKLPQAEFMVSSAAQVLTAGVAFHQCLQNV